MAYGRKKASGGRSGARKYSSKSSKGGRRSFAGRTSRGTNTLRIVIEPTPANAVQRPLVGVTAQPLGRRKF